MQVKGLANHAESLATMSISRVFHIREVAGSSPSVSTKRKSRGNRDFFCVPVAFGLSAGAGGIP